MNWKTQKGLQTICLMKVQFHAFYEDKTVRHMFGDSDDESEGSMSLQNAGQF